MSGTSDGTTPTVLTVHRTGFGWLVSLFVPGYPAFLLLTNHSAHRPVHVAALILGVVTATLTLRHPGFALPGPVRYGWWDPLSNIVTLADPRVRDQPLTVSTTWTTVTAEQLAETAHRASGLTLRTR